MRWAQFYPTGTAVTPAIASIRVMVLLCPDSMGWVFCFVLFFFFCQSSIMIASKRGFEEQLCPIPVRSRQELDHTVYYSLGHFIEFLAILHAL